MRVIRYHELESTQKYCIDNKETVEDKDVVVCDIQTKGIGRLGTNWISTEGFLTFSFCIFNVKNEYLAIVVAEAIKRVLERNKVENLLVKWPNDIFLRDQASLDPKKICGILINDLETKKGNLSIIGVGLNVSGTSQYTTLSDAGHSLSKELLLQQIPEEILISLKSTPNIYSMFPKAYAYLNSQKHLISIESDKIFLVREEEKHLITQQTHSYDILSNSFYKKIY
ncbi:BirA family transcriptional regulator, biotin operon repressor / biotin---[acetyl-CoA-carboxylase] ligase [Nematocida sp. LUAm3]|nr:BirA family transcriptional regulator, biotin operon repressor / biotin---[acetyl-CoA-carboxylase] ligase [Nematocida sp. LUAm3]KAI5173909.1 BirA family transcriptional regulator, biotin operon repressor / biotin---[acetyl-CoA-carboxylase] ligase [Nematocida sp. LUAm2]KAI5177346.1 BirA family transcriptional regulator, biotin operon repressor / biotin---[acetyl-CoA-carboxylase] ligase [Nematocida sp. LUAm1]